MSFKKRPKWNWEILFHTYIMIVTLLIKIIRITKNKIKEHLCEVPHKTRPVWTGFKIAVRHKLLTHNNTRLYTDYKKVNNIYIIDLL